MSCVFCIFVNYLECQVQQNPDFTLIVLFIHLCISYHTLVLEVYNTIRFCIVAILPHQTQHITFKHNNCHSTLTISTKIITRYTTSLSNLPSPHFCTIQQSLSNSFSSSNPKNKQICQPQSKHHCQLQLSNINNHHLQIKIKKYIKKQNLQYLQF